MSKATKQATKSAKKKRTKKVTKKVSEKDTSLPSERKIKDEKGRWIKVGSRVRGTFVNYDIEVHGHVTMIWESEKYGTVLAIEEKQGNIQNLPASRCRRMYGDTQSTKATKTVKKKKAAKKIRRKA